MPVKRVKDGGKIVGTMLRFVRNPGIAYIAKNAGLDFIMLDMEHGSYTMETLADACKVARGIDLGCFVRVPELARGYVSRALDCGATGVMVPMVESVAEAKSLAGWTKYAPVGNRGLGSSAGHTNFGGLGMPAPDFMARANQDTLTIAQIETKAAIEVIDQIAAVEGIDVLFIGPNDLSISLGYPGELSHPEVSKAIAKVAKAAAANKKIFGMHAGDALLEKWLPSGLTLIMNLHDINILTAGMTAIGKKYKPS
ncbi:MAG: aldolase [Spirochaeta sp.]|nr:aldolase [Spirochaeta sp.]